MDWIDAKTVYTIVHVFGAILGAGGAYVSDAMFFSSIKDRVISHRELQFMRLGSTFVWAGLIIAIVSGILLFSTNPEVYSQSSKFLLKVTLVGVIFLNGVYFHKGHMPLLHRHKDEHYPSSDEFMRRKKLLITSGVISMTTWTFVVILGMLRSIPIDLVTGLVGYVLFEFVAIMCARFIFKVGKVF